MKISLHIKIKRFFLFQTVILISQSYLRFSENYKLHQLWHNLTCQNYAIDHANY